MLQPGDYRLELPSSAAGMQTVGMTDSKKTVFVLPLTSGSAEPAPARSYLQLVNVDGTYFVRKYASSTTGRTTLFEVPKARHPAELADAKEVSASN
jgi:hypothetical protein